VNCRTALVFGATRGVGLIACRLLRSAGVSVTALVRQGSDRSALDALHVQVVSGDALSLDDVVHAFEVHGAGGLIISTLSGGSGAANRVDDIGNIHVINVSAKVGVDHFVLVTSLGCGNTRSFMSERALDAFGDALLAKTIAEDHLQRTKLPWTILRPGGLRDGVATYRGALFESSNIHGFICREDVALLALAVTADDRMIHRALIALDIHLIRSSLVDHPIPVLTVSHVSDDR
jgi:uncharacterized protein YbjT (DUF2867 family)